MCMLNERYVYVYVYTCTYFLVLLPGRAKKQRQPAAMCTLRDQSVVSNTIPTERKQDSSEKGEASAGQVQDETANSCHIRK